jgi:hypothetical protein
MCRAASEPFNGVAMNRLEDTMDVIAESALRILLRRRNLRDPVSRFVTRSLIRQSIAQVRAHASGRGRESCAMQ